MKHIVFVCDRCKKDIAQGEQVFQLESTATDENNTSAGITTSALMTNYINTIRGPLHLCQDCKDELDAFMRAER